MIKSFNHSLQQNQQDEGTGLGLSLSYDIIKAHGGEIKVETKEGEGSEFIISITQNNYILINIRLMKTFFIFLLLIFTVHFAQPNRPID